MKMILLMMLMLNRQIEYADYDNDDYDENFIDDDRMTMIAMRRRMLIMMIMMMMMTNREINYYDDI